MPSTSPTIILVHGGFVDGSGWAAAHKQLRAAGHDVLVAQHTTETLEGDVDTVTKLIDTVGGPVVLVAHSYGGFVISEAGNHEDVLGLVYISSFAPEVGDTIMSLLQGVGPGAQIPPIEPIYPGFLHLNRDKFREFFAADVDESDAAFMADSQLPWGAGAISSTVKDPAWKKKPTWYLVSKDDLMIPPRVQHMMAERAGSTTKETPGSHSAYVTQPDATASLILEAAGSVGSAS